MSTQREIPTPDSLPPALRMRGMRGPARRLLRPASTLVRAAACIAAGRGPAPGISGADDERVPGPAVEPLRWAEANKAFNDLLRAS